MNFIVNVCIYAIISILVGLFMYFLYIFTVLKKERKLKNFLNNGQVQAIVKKYNIDINKMDKNKVAKEIMKSNSCILTIVSFVALFFDNLIISVGLGFVLMLVLVFMEYKYLGKKLKKEVI